LVPAAWACSAHARLLWIGFNPHARPVMAEEHSTRLGDAVHYRTYRAGDEAKILERYNAVFCKSRTLAEWRWEYQDNPGQRLDIVLAETPSDLVGHTAAVPLTMRHDGRDVAAARIENVFVDSTFQRRGIFLASLLRLTDRLAAEVDYVITFPNDNSLPGFLRTGQYVHVCDIACFALPLAELRGSRSAECSIEIESAASLRVQDSEFAMRQLEAFAIHTTRSLEYLRWRYHPNSGRAYRVLRITRGGEQLGLAVAKAYPAARSLDLVEFLVMPEPALLNAVLAALAEAFAAQPLERVTLWSMPHYPMHGLLLDLGFAPETRVTHVLCKAFSARCSRRCGRPEAYYLAMGDSDVY
jgi:GNAT superfamily N-acetyltransferase